MLGEVLFESMLFHNRSTSLSVVSSSVMQLRDASRLPAEKVRAENAVRSITTSELE